jgi:hypothetical protein
MKISRCVVIAAGLSLVAAGCGSDSEPSASSTSSSSTGSSSTSGPSSTASVVDLDAMLLTAAEGPEGWVVMGDMSPEDLGSLGDPICPDTAINPTIIARLKATSAVILEPADGSLKGMQELLVTGEPDRLAADLDIVFDTVEVCGEEFTTVDGEKVQYVPFDIPDLGDQRNATTLKAFEPPDFQTTWLGHSAVVRVGSVALMLNQFEIVDTPDTEPSMSDAEFMEILERAVAKLESA